MPAFPKPTFDYSYNVQVEIKALRHWRDTKPGRAIPRKAADRLLLVTWNLANLGVQQRRDDDYRLIAEMLSWFDIAALQEVNENLAGLRKLMKFMPTRFSALFSDSAGNNERMVYLYDRKKVKLLELVGEIAVPPSDHQDIKLPGITQPFTGFDRNPYLAAFKAGSFTVLLVNVHLYFGKESEAASIERRCLETYAVARWADLNVKSKHAYATDIIALGDFNLPKADPADPVYKALTRRGLQLPPHSTEVGSAIASDSHYDQVAFFPSQTKQEFTGQCGVFDFDGAVFKTLWENRTPAQFRAYVRYYLSDHRPLWAEFRI
ncbi:MAG: endonuclease/exonuclease/phosphatase family protein [Verrucomicrobia bacterium]|nr:endonuclease/exonuclease/phosphatase family protein [Verrucomicrobiota bacterium]